MSRRIGFLGFDDVVALDLIGPMEAFSMAGDVAEGPSPYELVLIGITSRPFRTTSGVCMMPQVALDRAPTLDTLLVPGGSGLRTPAVARRLTRWLRRSSGRIRRVASVCTGLYGLAPSG